MWNDGFDREYDQAAYEEKIANLVRRLLANLRANDQNEFDGWLEAVRVLEKEDHYLLVLIAAAGASGRLRYAGVKLLGTALAIVAVMVAVALWASRP